MARGKGRVPFFLPTHIACFLSALHSSLHSSTVIHGNLGRYLLERQGIDESALLQTQPPTRLILPFILSGSAQSTTNLVPEWGEELFKTLSTSTVPESPEIFPSSLTAQAFKESKASLSSSFPFQHPLLPRFLPSLTTFAII